MSSSNFLLSSDRMYCALCVSVQCVSSTTHDTASLYQLEDLAKTALMFMVRHATIATDVLHYEAFLSLSESAIKTIISRIRSVKQRWTNSKLLKVGAKIIRSGRHQKYPQQDSSGAHHYSRFAQICDEYFLTI